jgi:aldose 1-epimerase
MTTTELKTESLRATLRPDLGAGIAGLWLHGVPVLRSIDDAAALEGPRASGCFALVPYSNRIGWRRFTWQGRAYELRANFQGEDRHAIHGSAWLRAWDVVETDAARATLRFAQTPDEHWPFAFEVTQRFELLGNALRIELDLRNTDTVVQPAGLGWHPYFPKRSASRIHIECHTRWERDDTTHLPTRRVPQRGIDAEVRHLDFDHGFEGWGAAGHGHARVRDELLSITVASSLEHLVVFTPPQRPYFCIEPVSHAINALGAEDPIALGVHALEPGAAMHAWMTIEAAPR